MKKEGHHVSLMGSSSFAFCCATDDPQLRSAMQAKGYKLHGSGILQKEIGRVGNSEKLASVITEAERELSDERLYVKMIRAEASDDTHYMEIPPDCLISLGSMNIYMEASSRERGRKFAVLLPEELLQLREAAASVRPCVFLARGAHIQGMYGNIIEADRVREGSGFEALECDSRWWVNTEYEYWETRVPQELEEAIADLSEKLMMNEGERKVLQIVTEPKGAIIRIRPAWLRRLGSANVSLCLR